MEDYLVPGRECGSCSACCTHLAINEDGMNKDAGVPCPHLCNGQGCSIYTKRPNVCSAYHCLWRSVDNLGDEWRPDRCGILMQLNQVPPEGEGEFGVDLILIGEPEVVVSDKFAGMVGGFIESGTIVRLHVPPGPGLLAPSIIINQTLAMAIRARDLAAVKDLILRCYQYLESQPHMRAPETDVVQPTL